MVKKSDNLDRYLGIYSRELLGWVFKGRLQLPLSVTAGFFISLYFGVLLILHLKIGSPFPPSIAELFSVQTNIFYYPNLIGIAYDLIGNPMLLVLLVFFRDYVPHQFNELKKNGVLQEKVSQTLSARLLGVALNSYAQIFLINILPIILSLTLAVFDMQFYQPEGAPSKYGIFLSALGRYVVLVFIIEIAYIFLILKNYSIKISLQLKHPDNCSGTSPFGNLAIATYFVFFIWAMMEAIGISVGGSALLRSMSETSKITTVAFLWILFPLISLFVFEQLIYSPHCLLQSIQTEYLEKSRKSWAGLHKDIKSSLSDAIKKSGTPSSKKSSSTLSDSMHNLETWDKLDQYVIDMHTWPISKTTIRTIALFINPLLPLLFPVVVDYIVSNIL